MNNIPEFFFIPRDLFYIRNHLPVPLVDEKEYELEITGIGVKDKTLSLNDLKSKFKKVSVTATVQCAGNRRSDMVKVLENFLLHIFVKISLRLNS